MSFIFKITIILSMCAGFLTKSVFKIDRFDVCENPNKSPFRFNKVNVRTVNYQAIIESDFDLARNVSKIKNIANMTRCANRELLDSCEFFGSYPLKDSCLLYNQKVGLFYEFARSYTPNYKCPFIKGHYVQKNFTIDAVLSVPAFGNGYWKFINEVRDHYTSELYFTMCIDGQTIKIRN